MIPLPSRIDGKLNLVVVSTGSVASIKVPILLDLLEPYFTIILLPSPTSLKFFTSQVIDPNTNARIYEDKDEWESWRGRGDGVLHIDIRNWADILLIAPCSAHTMAMISAGLCDSLRLEVLRAWDNSKPVFVAPTMNTQMFLHPVTKKQIETLTIWGYYILGPIEKTLMCGDTGIGAMMEPEDIVRVILETIEERKSLMVKGVR